MTPEVIHFSVLAPIGFVAIGAMMVLLGEVFLSRATTFLGHRVTTPFIGSFLALVAGAALLLSLVMACQWFVSGATLTFNPGRPLLQLDSFSALTTTWKE